MSAETHDPILTPEAPAVELHPMRMRAGSGVASLSGVEVDPIPTGEVPVEADSSRVVVNMGHRSRLVVNMGHKSTPEAGPKIAPTEHSPIAERRKILTPENAEVEATELADVAAHNGWVGMTWKKGGEERTITGVKKTEVEGQTRWDLIVTYKLGDKDQSTKIPMNRFTLLFTGQISDGLASDVVIPNNSERITAGELHAFDRDERTGKFVER